MYIVNDNNFKINNKDVEINTERSNIFIPVDTIDHVFHTRGSEDSRNPKPDLIELYTHSHDLIYTLRVQGEVRAIRIYLELVKEVRNNRKEGEYINE
ncbi:hypothetical protein [Erysipelothrix anatis]|uniref:hypothetical protein n=1 Tax=Erysipelothrix anatis TaxID=2683713 RepID=UPI00140B581E|nr:hypothetical protein [Erysipelothrix anatis]